MKFCLMNRQSGALLRSASEIKMEYRDYKSIPQLFEEYPGTPVIIDLDQEEVDWRTLETYRRMRPSDLICCVRSRFQAEIARDLKIKFYYGFPISNYLELKRWLNLGVCYVRLDAPLFFDLPNVVKITGETPIRAVANIAYEELWDGETGIHGTWIRPEDVNTYEPYISTIEFEDCDIKKEQALYKLYAEQHKWPGSVSLLISNLLSNAANRLLPPQLAEKRLSCKQQCESFGHCERCDLYFKLADPETLRRFREESLDATNQN